MDDYLWMIILAFVAGFMLQDMMKNICGGRLVEGITYFGDKSLTGTGDDCKKNSECSGRNICAKGHFWKKCTENCTSTDQCGGRNPAGGTEPRRGSGAVCRDRTRWTKNVYGYRDSRGHLHKE